MVWNRFALPAAPFAPFEVVDSLGMNLDAAADAYPITQAAVGLPHDRAELPAFAGSDLFEHVDLCSTTSGIHWTRHERDCPSFSDLAQKSAAKWTPQWTPKPLFCGHHGGHHGDKSLI